MFGYLDSEIGCFMKENNEYHDLGKFRYLNYFQVSTQFYKGKMTKIFGKHKLNVWYIEDYSRYCTLAVHHNSEMVNYVACYLPNWLEKTDITGLVVFVTLTPEQQEVALGLLGSEQNKLDFEELCLSAKLAVK